MVKEALVLQGMELSSFVLRKSIVCVLVKIGVGERGGLVEDLYIDVVQTF